MTIQTVTNVMMAKGDEVVEIQHTRHEGIILPKMFKGADAVKVVGVKGRCVMVDERCMAPAAADKKVRAEVARLAKQGWALVEQVAA